MKRIIFLFLSIAAAGILFCKFSMKQIAVVLAAGLLFSCIICFLERKITQPEKYAFVHKRFFIPDILLVSWLMIRFYSRWGTHSAIMTFISDMKMSLPLVLGIVSCILGVIALHAIDTIFVLSESLITQVSKKGQIIDNAYNLLALLVIVFMQNMILNYSGLQTFVMFGQQSIVATVFNTLVILSINLLFALLIRNWKITLTLTTVIFWVYSVADYYVVKFHGSPLYFSEFANARTAANVLSSYQLEIGIVVIVISVIALALIAEIILFVSYGSIFNKKMKKTRFGMTLAMLLLCSAAGFFGFKKIDPKSHAWAPWTEGLQVSGFIYESIYDLQKRQNPIVEPEGYNVESIRNLESDPIQSADYPDIILILNETFCDLSSSVNFEADADPMAAFKEIDGAAYGHAVIANIGGGTNDSEFELLTSNSRYLLNSSAPFTFLSKEQLKNSIVRYLEEGFGYETSGMHCGTPGNYSRNIAYPYLGFDNIYLGEEAFKYKNSYGNRPWLDADNYHDLTDHYEEGGEGPRFMYLLTFQNHGGYEQNEASYDTVHVKTDFGNLTDDVNEYLTSMQSSAAAFRDLTDYFKDSKRKVIICMVGDHAPAFIADLPNDTESPVDDESINKCTVPYVIWSNYGAEVTSYTDYATMTDLVPMTLKAAGLPLSAYYKSVLDLHEMLPIRTKTGKYYDRDFNSGVFEGSTDKSLLSSYLYMEYNSLHAGDDYADKLYTVSAK